MPRRSRHTAEQIIEKLRQVEAATAQGSTVADAVRSVGISEQTFYRWRNKYANMGKPEALCQDPEYDVSLCRTRRLTSTLKSLLEIDYQPRSRFCRG